MFMINRMKKPKIPHCRNNFQIILSKSKKEAKIYTPNTQTAHFPGLVHVPQ